jgi:hypothetical protein
MIIKESFEDLKTTKGLMRIKTFQPNFDLKFPGIVCFTGKISNAQGRYPQSIIIRNISNNWSCRKVLQKDCILWIFCSCERIVS